MAKNQTRAAGSLVSPFRTARKGLGLGFETEYSKKRDGFFLQPQFLDSMGTCLCAGPVRKRP